MFFEIGPKEYDDKFSYVIIKHPDNIFEREIGSGRKVVAYFDEDRHNYKGYVENDPIKFLNTARQLNLSSYVHTQLSAVCPHNLLGFDETFRTAIRGNFKKDDINIYNHSLKEKHWSAFIGPYPCKFEIIQEWFEIVGIEVNNFTNRDYLDSMVQVVDFQTIRKMTLSEFLQKIYLISYYLTIKHEITPIKNDRISKFVYFCTDWIEEIEGNKRNRLINTLSNHKKSYIKKFENLLIDESDLDDGEKQIKRSEVEDFINRKGLHQKRHEIITKLIKSETINTSDKNRLIELGCGSGQFLKYIDKQFKGFDILGIEVNSKRISRNSIRSKKSNNINIKNSSGLNPNIRFTDLNPNYLVCTEVLEHIEEYDRINLVRLMKDFYNPDVIIITVPNIDYNKYIPGLLDEDGNYNGKYRHNDHKIEYTKNKFQKEVVSILEEKYYPTWYNLIDEEDIDEQPSFVVHFTKTRKNTIKDNDKQQKIYDRISKLYNPIHLPVSNYEIREKELEKGYSSFPFIKNSNNIFYLAPTMPPTESVFDDNKESFNYIEHPDSVIDYYNKRGVDEIYAEEKYMGSRGYVLLFKDLETAKKAGYDNEIIINSRGGFTFFDNDDLNKLDYKKIQDVMKKDFIAFDCEIMPWSYKAKNLIDFEFIVPGQCSYLSRKFGNYGNVEYAKEYLNTLNNYIEDNDIEIRIFNILATGNIYLEKYTNKFLRYTNVTIGMFKDREWHYNLINYITEGNEIFKPVVYYPLNSNDLTNIDNVVYEWKKFTEERNGEGFVFKPKYSVLYTNDGYMLQPSIKVRGKKYLQLIYGIDYKDKDYFEMVKRRKIVRKRKLAILQHEIGINILRSWLKGDNFNREKYIASFLGSEEANIKGIDATL